MSEGVVYNVDDRTWNASWRQIYLEDSSKLSLPNISDVDDVVPWILQQLQPGQKELFNKATKE